MVLKNLLALLSNVFFFGVGDGVGGVGVSGVGGVDGVSGVGGVDGVGGVGVGAAAGYTGCTPGANTSTRIRTTLTTDSPKTITFRGKSGSVRLS